MSGTRPGTGLRAATGFLTVVGGAAAPGPRALAWFGTVGAAVGAAVGATRWGLDGPTGPFLAAVLAVCVDLALTGMLHVDGLADSADGLLPPLPRERRLEIMRRPDVGAFGVAVVVVVLLLRSGALADATVAPTTIAAVAAIWGASRTVMVAVLLTRPHARPDGGLPGHFGGTRRGVTLVACAVPVLAVAAVAGPAGAIAVAATVGAGLVVAATAERRLGGYTGDVLGALGVIGETVGLIALVVVARVG